MYWSNRSNNFRKNLISLVFINLEKFDARGCTRLIETPV